MLETWQEMIRELDEYGNLRFIDVVVDAGGYATAIGNDGDTFYLFAGSFDDTDTFIRLGPARSNIERTGDGEDACYTYAGTSGAKTTISRKHILEHYLVDRQR